MQINLTKIDLILIMKNEVFKRELHIYGTGHGLNLPF